MTSSDRLTPELKESTEIARYFHETYERLAPDFDYKTREASAKPWKDVPENNQYLMIAVANEVRKKFLIVEREKTAELEKMIISLKGDMGHSVPDGVELPETFCKNIIADALADELTALKTELEKSNKLYFNDQEHFEKKVTENKKLKDLLRECQWRSDSAADEMQGIIYCLECGYLKEDGCPPDCKITKAIGEKP